MATKTNTPNNSTEEMQFLIIHFCLKATTQEMFIAELEKFQRIMHIQLNAIIIQDIREKLAQVNPQDIGQTWFEYGLKIGSLPPECKSPKKKRWLGLVQYQFELLTDYPGISQTFIPEDLDQVTQEHTYILKKLFTYALISSDPPQGSGGVNYKTFNIDELQPDFQRFLELDENKQQLDAFRKNPQTKWRFCVNFESLRLFDENLAQLLIVQPEVWLRICSTLVHDNQIMAFIPKNEYKWHDWGCSVVIDYTLGEFTDFTGLTALKTDTFVKIRAIVVDPGVIHPQITLAEFECPLCNNQMQLEQLTAKLTPPRECSNPSCKNTKDFKVVSQESTYIDIRRIEVNEYRENAFPESNTIPVILFHDFNVELGDLIEITGVLKNTPKEDKRGRLSTEFHWHIAANNSRIVQKQFLHRGDQSKLCYGLNTEGIYSISPDGVQVLWKWNSFDITEKLIHRKNNAVEYRYSGTYNGNVFFDKSIDQIANFLASECIINKKYLSLIGILIQKYVRDKNIPQFETTDLMGFSELGWKLPDNAKVIMNAGIQSDIAENLKKMVTLKINDEEVKKKFRALYDAIHWKQKDIFIAYLCIAQYQYAMIDITHLILDLALWGMPKIGKSFLAEIFCLIWCNLTNEAKILTRLQMNESRGLEYLSSSTFPLPIDDCGEMADVIKSEIKASRTGKARMQRKNKWGQLEIDKPITNPLVYTFNELPLMFNDGAYLERVLILREDHKPTSEQIKKGQQAIENIKKGEIGKYIIEQTKTWDLSTLKQFYNSIPDNPTCTDARMNTIWRLLSMGARFAYIWFGLKLDLKDLPKIIDETRILGNTEIIDLIQDQINICSLGFTKDEFVHPIFIHTLKEGISGYLYDVWNLQDLKKTTKDYDWNLDRLTSVLQNRFGEGVFKDRITYEHGTKHRIFIPADVFSNDISEEGSKEKQKNPVSTNLSDKSLREISRIILQLKTTNKTVMFDINDLFEPLSPNGFSKEDIYKVLNEFLKQDLITVDKATKQYCLKNIGGLKNILKGVKKADVGG